MLTTPFEEEALALKFPRVLAVTVKAMVSKVRTANFRTIIHLWQKLLRNLIFLIFLKSMVKSSKATINAKIARPPVSGTVGVGVIVVVEVTSGDKVGLDLAIVFECAFWVNEGD